MRLFAFDFETFCIAPMLQAPPIVCMSYTVDDGAPELLHVRDSRLLKVLTEALDDPECTLVAHNAAYEVTCAMAQWPHLTEKLFAKLTAGKLYCTQTAQRLIHISKGELADDVSLKVSLQYHPDTKHLQLDKECWWRVRYGLLINTPVDLWPQDAYDYAIGDTAVGELYTAQLHHYADAVQDNIARTVTTKAGTQCFVAGQTWASVMLSLGTCHGFPTDRRAADALWERTLVELEGYQTQLLNAGMLALKFEKGVPKYTRPKAPAERLMAAAFQKMGRPVPRNALTGAALVKAYARQGIVVEAERDHKGEYVDLKDEDIQEALDHGCDPQDLLGNISLDAEACEASQHPLLKAYAEYGSSSTLKGRIRRLKKPLIQARYVPIINSGRTSCRQGDGPKPGEPWMAYGSQLQNPPRD